MDLKKILLATAVFILPVCGILFTVTELDRKSTSEAQLRRSVVMLTSANHLCSGQQIKARSGTTYILTAGHCGVLAVDGSIEVHTEDGRTLMRRVIAEDQFSDLLLLEGAPDLEGVEVAKYLAMHSHVRSFTHGRGHKTYKTDGELIDTVRLQVLLQAELAENPLKCISPKAKLIDYNFFGIALRLCILDVLENTSTAVIQPGSSGGLLVDDFGSLVGVASAGGDGFSYWVTLQDINNFLGNY